MKLSTEPSEKPGGFRASGERPPPAIPPQLAEELAEILAEALAEDLSHFSNLRTSESESPRGEAFAAEVAQ
jgi:hypothetical protein